MECYQALRYCSKPRWIIERWKRPEALTYPEDTNEILFTWEERADAWLNTHANRRQGSCEKYLGQKITIDECSYEGNAQFRQANRFTYSL